MIPTFSFRESATFTPFNIGCGRDHDIRRDPCQTALWTELNQCHQRDFRRTTEPYWRTKDANPAGRIHRHSRGQAEPLHEPPAARRRSNRASNGQPHLTTVTVTREL